MNSFLLGIGTGLLWAPCAGPILGLILTGAALGGASAHTAALLLAYAAGAATSLGLALLAGGRVFAAMKRSLGAEEWIRRILGVAILAGVVAVAFGLDRGVLTRLSLSSTASLEQRLVDRFHPHSQQSQAANDQTAGSDGNDSGPGPAFPELTGATAWINSPPLTPESLRGKVVLVDFWTYSCINCLRTLPYIKAWYEKYKDSGLVIIGVHTPEFPFEKDEANVRKAVKELGITYPVRWITTTTSGAISTTSIGPRTTLSTPPVTFATTTSARAPTTNPKSGFAALLEEANHQPLPGPATNVAATGTEAAPDSSDVNSPETYVGYERAENFASPGGLKQDAPQLYQAPATLNLNQWAFTGKWNDARQIATSLEASASIVYRFHARDLHLVLGPSKDGKPVRFRVTIDGKAPGADHGMDIDADGYGTVTEDRLYQLIRQQGAIQDRTFRIEFLSPGVQAYSFTFG